MLFPCVHVFPRAWPGELSLGTRLVFLLLFPRILHISCTFFKSPLLSFAHPDTSLPGCLPKLSRCQGIDSCLSHSHHGRWHGCMWGSTEVPSRVGHQRPGRVDGAASGGKNYCNSPMYKSKSIPSHIMNVVLLNFWLIRTLSKLMSLRTAYKPHLQQKFNDMVFQTHQDCNTWRCFERTKLTTHDGVSNAPRSQHMTE